MIRKILSLLFLLTLTTPIFAVNAQDDEPKPYVECGAREYLTQRQNLTYVLNLAITEADQYDLARQYYDITFPAREDFLRGMLEMEEIPECAAKIHELTIERTLTDLEYEFFFILGKLPDAEAQAARSDDAWERADALSDQLVEELVGIGWLYFDEVGERHYTEWTPPEVSATTTLSPTPAADDSAAAGFGSFQNPYPFGEVAESAEEFTLKVVGSLRGGDRIVRQSTGYVRPARDETTIIVRMEVICPESTETCDVGDYEFELVGDQGTLYDSVGFGSENVLDFSILGGITRQGDLYFLVKKNDANLKLVYDNTFGDDNIVFDLLPPQDQGVQITANQNVNIRSGPDGNAERLSSFPNQETRTAFGRNTDGTWLRVDEGWVSAEFFDIEGDPQTLPIVWE